VSLSPRLQPGDEVAAIREAGLVRRDLKPANVLLDLEGPSGGSYDVRVESSCDGDRGASFLERLASFVAP
jgi:serine/threonine protein kinase